jgi:hypothetical protein
MSKLVKDATLQEILNNGISADNDGDYSCELCNLSFELRMDVLEHIIYCHMDEELLEEYVVVDDSKYCGKPVQPEETINQNELEIH